MCRAALKMAGYKDEAVPVHNEELGACRSDCACGRHEDAEAELMLVSNTPSIVEIELTDGTTVAFETAEEAHDSYDRDIARMMSSNSNSWL